MHACSSNSAYGQKAKRQLVLVWITAPWLVNCSINTPHVLSHLLINTHFLDFIGLFPLTGCCFIIPAMSFPSVYCIAALGLLILHWPCSFKYWNPWRDFTTTLTYLKGFNLGENISVQDTAFQQKEGPQKRYIKESIICIFNCMKTFFLALSLPKTLMQSACTAMIYFKSQMPLSIGHQVFSMTRSAYGNVRSPMLVWGCL